MLLKQGYINVLRIILTSRTLKRGNIFGKIERKITRNMIRLLQSKNFQKRIWFLQECSKLQCGTIFVGSSLQTTFCNKICEGNFWKEKGSKHPNRYDTWNNNTWNDNTRNNNATDAQGLVGCTTITGRRKGEIYPNIINHYRRPGREILFLILLKSKYCGKYRSWFM